MWKQRLIEEANALIEKIVKIQRFKETDIYGQLSTIEKDMLTTQLEHMKNYFTILDRRIIFYVVDCGQES